MAKRAGETTVEWVSPERKRLRQAAPDHVSRTPFMSEIKKRVDRLTAILQHQQQTENLPQAMSNAIELIQGLQWLQTQNTPGSRRAFDVMYSNALSYVGGVIDRLAKVDELDISEDADDVDNDGSLQESFAGAYQFLMELISKHNECGDGSVQLATDLELTLIMLPIALNRHFNTDTASLLPPQLESLKSVSQTNRPLLEIALRNIPTALALTALAHGVYTDGLVEWFIPEFCRYLSRPTEPELRSLAWSLFPLVCFGARLVGKDAFALAGKQFSITVDDSPQLLGIAARSLGAVSCARSGRLALQGFPAELVDTDMDDGEDASPGTLCVVDSIMLSLDSEVDIDIMGIYRCRDCDHASLDQQQRQPVTAADAEATDAGGGMEVCMGDETGSVSLSDWVPYWFIARNRDVDATPAKFLRSISRFVQHAPVGDIDLRTSSIGIGTIRHLGSSSREIRLAAKDAILAYSRGHAPSETAQVAAVRRSNRSETMQELVKLSRSFQEPSIIEETLQLVAGGVGCACKFQEPTLGQAVSFLVKYYCRDNIFFRAVSMEQLLLISQTHTVSLAKLLSTFSRDIACTLADTLTQSLPQPFVHCMQILETTPERFVRQHQDTIIPELMATGNETALRHIAQILNVRLPVLCVNQAPSIFAKMFLLDDQLMDAAMQRFVHLITTESDMRPDQVEVNIPTLLRSCSVKLLFNLILSLGSDDSVLRRRARSALLTVRNIIGVSGPEARHDVSAIVQTSVDNMKSIGAADSPRRDGRRKGVHKVVDRQLADFLSKHVLGILAYMNEVLQDADSTTATSGGSNSVKHYRSEQSRRQALRAMGDLAVLLGSHAALYTNNIVASLSPSLVSPLASVTLESWGLLAESLSSVSLTADQLNSLIVPLLSTFLVSASDVRLGAAHAVNRVVHIHAKALKSSYASICPIPDDPLLSQSFAVLRESETHRSLRQRLAQLTQLLKTKDATIVFCTAREMCLLLKQHEKQICVWKSALSPGTSGEPDVWEDARSRGNTLADASLLVGAMSALRMACRVSGRLSNMAAASCAACLATIGFIDSQKLNMAVSSLGAGGVAASSGHMESAPILSDLSDADEQREFVCKLVADHLAHLFALAPSPGTQSYAAFAIQELLHQVGFTKDTLFGSTDDPAATQSTRRSTRQTTRETRQLRSNTRTQAVGEEDTAIRQRWELLPSQVIEIIRPLLDSKYTSQSSSRLPSTTDLLRDRTMCITRATSQASWLRSWIIELIGQLGDAQVAPIFRVCTSAIKEGSTDMLLFILPQLVYQHCLLSPQSSTKPSTPAHVITVDSQDSASEDVDMEGSSANMTAIDLISQEILAVLSCSAEDVRMPNDQWRQCKEATLGLLDSLNKCLRRLQDGRAADKPSTRTTTKEPRLPPEEQTLVWLVESVPHSLIASAADACHQFARAIQHTELSLREGAFGKHPTLFRNADDPAVATIQELYFKMGDADGVTGAAVCRKEMDHKLTILKYEIEGNWSHALIGHESLLRSQPDNTDYQMGWIRCMQRMGQWEGAWTVSHDLYKPDPLTQQSEEMNSLCDAAAWRLSKWRWVEDKDTVRALRAQKDDCAASFDTTLSSLLAKVHRQRSLVEKLTFPLPISTCVPIKAGPGYDVTVLELASSALQNIGREFAGSVTSFGSLSSGTRSLMGTNISPDMIQAHMLGDIGLLANHMNGTSSENSGLSIVEMTSLVEQWRARVACLPPIYSVQEPVLALHSSLYSMLQSGIRSSSSTSDADSNHAAAISEMLNRRNVLSHLQAAQLARLAGFRATALGILIHAELNSSLPASLLASLQTERAQIQWDEGNTTDAMAEIGRVVGMLSDRLNLTSESEKAVQATFTAGVNASSESSTDPDQLSQDVGDVKSAFVKATLLLAQWQQETNAVSSSVLLDHHMRIQRVQESDKSHYALGRLYDNLYTAIADNKPSRSGENQEHRDYQVSTLQYYVIRNYSRTIMYSSRYLFQALPRLLTIWLDAGAYITSSTGATNSRVVERFNTANRVVSNMAKRLPTYNFLIVLSQLISRICHPNDEVFAVLEYIILSVLEMYPQQTLWQLVGVQRSTYVARAERCNTILAKARAMNRTGVGSSAGRGRGRGIATLINHASRLTDLLLGLCNATTPSRSVTTLHMSKDFRDLARCNAMDIIIPLQNSLTPTLPDTSRGGAEYELALSSMQKNAVVAGGRNAQTASQQAMMHQPFSSDLPTISGFADEVEVMNSLQRPKKIVIIGSDGQRYRFLCKPKDDLRKDARLMEFNAMINQLLQANQQTQKRNLHIRTYAVVPLNEECGLIQWVGSTTGIRQILMKQYKEHSVKIQMSEVKAILAKTSPSPQEIFTKELLPLFPSVMHEWFLWSFPCPERWLMSRTAFTRTAAVMSMVGYILGLGDRHCENIMLDERSGDVLHVDFNCLFEKGLLLEKPEKVPFRLTHNMVDAMGVTGYEGTFRKTCEMTLRLLREHRDALMSVLEPFVHDPLVEWSKRLRSSSKASVSAKDPTRPNAQATKSLATINKKLQGALHSQTPLSVEGQVDELIREATDPKRLFQMYIGWAAYM